MDGQGDESLHVEWLSSSSDIPVDPRDESRIKARRRTLRRRQLIAAAAVAIIGGATAAVWFATRPDPPLRFTVGGRSVEDPSGLIARADTAFGKYAHAHFGAVSPHSRCYFDRVGGRVATNIGIDAFCGPVLFYGLSTSDDYLQFALPEIPGGPSGSAALSVVAHPESEVPSAIPAGANLLRPDRRRPPKGAGGLQPPPPPPVPASFVALAAGKDLPNLQPMPSTAVIGSRNVDVHLVASGRIPSIGRGLGLRVAPHGESLRAFELRFLDGEEQFGSSDTASAFGLSVDGGAPRVLAFDPQLGLNETSLDSTLYLVAALPDSARTVDLVVVDGGLEQRMSLLTGVPAQGNIAILQRPQTQRLVNVPTASVVVPAVITGNGKSISTKLSVDLDYAYLGYFTTYTGNEHASGPDRALLSLEFCYRSPQLHGQDNTVGAARCSVSSNFSVTPDGGVPVRAHEYPDRFIAMDVPASFTSGVVTFFGPEDLGDGTTLRLDHPVRIHFAIPR